MEGALDHRLFKCGLVVWALAMALASMAARSQTPNHAPSAGASCPNDKLVWVNTRSGVYHFQGERYYGSTKQGKFTCERDANKEGDWPTRNGQ